MYLINNVESKEVRVDFKMCVFIFMKLRFAKHTPAALSAVATGLGSGERGGTGQEQGGGRTWQRDSSGGQSRARVAGEAQQWHRRVGLSVRAAARRYSSD